MAIITFEGKENQTLRPRKGLCKLFPPNKKTMAEEERPQKKTKSSKSCPEKQSITSRILLPSLQQKENNNSKPATRQKRRHKRIDSDSELMGLQFLADDSATNHSKNAKSIDVEDDNWDELSVDQELCVLVIDDTMDDCIPDSPTSLAHINDNWIMSSMSSCEKSCGR